MRGQRAVHATHATHASRAAPDTIERGRYGRVWWYRRGAMDAETCWDAGREPPMGTRPHDTVASYCPGFPVKSLQQPMLWRP